MVRIINIDTKTRTIRVSNGKDDLDWFTTDTGSHVPLKKGQSKAEAIKEHFGDKKQNPQLDRLEKMGKAWGKDQMSVLRELGKTNPQGLKDELDRIDSERERTTKAHKEWLKEKTAKQQPAKQAPYSDPFHKEAEQKRNAAKDAWLKAKPQVNTKKLRAGDPETFEKYMEWRWQATTLSDGYDEMMKDFGGRDEFNKAAQAYEKLKQQPAKQEPEEKAKSEPAARDVMKESATDWYAKAFKSDKKMAPKNGVTFEQLYESLKKGENIYDKMGVGDSIVRERVMSEMADRLGVDYDHVYDLWLNGGEKGSESRKKKQEESIALMDKLLKQTNIDPGVKKAIIAARKRAKQDIQ